MFWADHNELCKPGYQSGPVVEDSKRRHVRRRARGRGRQRSPTRRSLVWLVAALAALGAAGKALTTWIDDRALRFLVWLVVACGAFMSAFVAESLKSQRGR